MKVNKNVHIMILLTLAIVFVVVYLYYTINDVKKLGAELKKNTQDIQSVAASLNNLNKTVNELKVSSAVSVKQVCTAPVEKEPEPVDEPEEEEEDDEITQDDMKKLLNEIPSSDDEDEEKPELAPLDQEELKKMKLEDLRSLCKDRDVSSKGTKDQLIARLVA